MDVVKGMSADVGGVELQESNCEQRDDVLTTGEDGIGDTMKAGVEAGLVQTQEMGRDIELVGDQAGPPTARKSHLYSAALSDGCAGGTTVRELNTGRPRQIQVKVGRCPISRWVVFVLYCCYCLLAGPSFLNWTTIADMLYKADAYMWECKPDTLIVPPPEPHKAKCPAQEIAVNHLFSVASASYFVFAMLGGIMLDYAGPKLGALSGLTCLLLGWLLLAFSSDGFRAYVPAMVFAGAGIDMAFFPCLCGANLFPGFTATIIALFGACRSISFVIGLALRGMFFNIPSMTLRTTLLCYVGVGLGFCVCTAVILIPWAAWPPLETEGTQEKEPARKATSGGQWECDNNIMKKDNSIKLEHEGTAAAESCTDTRSGPVNTGADSEQLQGHGQSASTEADVGVCGLHGDAREMQTTATRYDEGVSQQKTGEKEQSLRSTGARRTAALQLQVSLKSFVRDFRSPFFLPLIPYFVFVLIDILFFTPSADRLIPDAYAANQIISVCGFAPCIVLGNLADRIGIIHVMIFCNSTGLLAWVLLLIPKIPCFTAFQYMASILFTIQMSFLVSQIYCYVTEMFPPENLGKLIGFLCSTGGILSLVTSSMRDYSVKNTFYPMVVLCLVLAAVNEGLLAFMLYWRRRTNTLKQNQRALTDRANEGTSAV